MSRSSDEAERSNDDVDPEVARLDTETRRSLGEIWARRAKSEIGAGSAFARVVVALYDIGAHPDVVALATRAAAEEVAHARQCQALATLYLGDAVDFPPPKRVGMPPHRGASDPLRATLHVMGMCCFSETIAVEFISRQLDASSANTIRRASRLHLRDEIGHARVGWAHLGSDCLDKKDKREVSRWMARMTKANAQHWLTQVEGLPESGVDGHGYAPRQHFRQGVIKAVSEVIVPGLAEAGLDATGAAREAAALSA